MILILFLLGVLGSSPLVVAEEQKEYFRQEHAVEYFWTLLACQRLGVIAEKLTNCQVYHVCLDSDIKSFVCPSGLVFNQKIKACDFPHNVDCSKSGRMQFLSLILRQQSNIPKESYSSRQTTPTPMEQYVDHDLIETEIKKQEQNPGSPSNVESSNAPASTILETLVPHLLPINLPGILSVKYHLLSSVLEKSLQNIQRRGKRETNETFVSDEAMPSKQYVDHDMVEGEIQKQEKYPGSSSNVNNSTAPASTILKTLLPQLIPINIPGILSVKYNLLASVLERSLNNLRIRGKRETNETFVSDEAMPSKQYVDHDMVEGEIQKQEKYPGSSSNVNNSTAPASTILKTLLPQLIPINIPGILSVKYNLLASVLERSLNNLRLRGKRETTSTFIPDEPMLESFIFDLAIPLFSDIVSDLGTPNDMRILFKDIAVKSKPIITELLQDSFPQIAARIGNLRRNKRSPYARRGNFPVLTLKEAFQDLYYGLGPHVPGLLTQKLPMMFKIARDHGPALYKLKEAFRPLIISKLPLINAMIKAALNMGPEGFNTLLRMKSSLEPFFLIAMQMLSEVQLPRQTFQGYSAPARRAHHYNAYRSYAYSNGRSFY